MSNELSEESLLEKAGGVKNTRDTWSLWVEKGQGSEDVERSKLPQVNPVRKENFNPPRDFNVGRMQGSKFSKFMQEVEPEFFPAFLQSVIGPVSATRFPTGPPW